MRVLNAGQNYRITGGSDRYLFSLESLLKSRGVEVVPFAAAHPENVHTPWSRYFPRRVDFDRPGLGDVSRYLYSRAARRCIDSLLSDFKFDLAHLHIYYGQLTGSILGRLVHHSVPIVQTLHEYKLICPTYMLMSNGRICEACGQGGFMQAVLNRCNRGSLARSLISAGEASVTKALGSISSIDHFIAVSDFLRSKMVEHGIPETRVTTVHNFIDASLYQPSHEAGDYFLFFGRLERIKGIYSLIEAIAPLKDVRLVIAGDGAERAGVAAACQGAKHKNIEYVGFRRGAALAELIQGARAVVAPSEWYETFGLTLIEGFAHGRPVICTRMGGMPEVVDEGVDGVVVPPGDIEALREAVLSLWRAPAAAIEMGREGRSKVETRFGVEPHLEGIRSVYRKVGVTIS